MLRPCMLGLALGLVPGLLLAQQAAAPALPATNTIEVSAQGTAHAQPDTAVVSFEINGQNQELKVAYAQAQDQSDKISALLRQQGFGAADWSSYRVQPDINYRTHVVTGYTVSTDLDLEIADFTKIGPLLDAASGEGLSALRDVSFELKNQQAAKASAIADGYGQTEQEAEALATAAGEIVDGLDHASVDVSVSPLYPQPRMMSLAGMAAAGAPTAPFTPSQITVTARITAIYRMHH